jgi:hypothetical protein
MAGAKRLGVRQSSGALFGPPLNLLASFGFAFRVSTNSAIMFACQI